MHINGVWHQALNTLLCTTPSLINTHQATGSHHGREICHMSGCNGSTSLHHSAFCAHCGPMLAGHFDHGQFPQQCPHNINRRWPTDLPTFLMFTLLPGVLADMLDICAAGKADQSACQLVEGGAGDNCHQKQARA